jgi:hypothetical protein
MTPFWRYECRLHNVHIIQMRKLLFVALLRTSYEMTKIATYLTVAVAAVKQKFNYHD